MKILFTLAVLSTLLTVIYSQDDVYEGPISFFVHVVFDGEFICGASFISSKYALAPYMPQFQDFMQVRLALLVPTHLYIFHIEYDENYANLDKFAVIAGSKNPLFQVDCESWIDRALMSDRDTIISSNETTYTIGWQQSTESPIIKTYTAQKTDFTPRDVGIRINNQIDFKKYIGGALIKNDKLIGIALSCIDYRDKNKPYVLYLSVFEREHDICQLLDKFGQRVQQLTTRSHRDYVLMTHF